MEGKKITCLVKFKNDEVNFRLSEYDTIGDLKHMLCEKFDLIFNEFELFGWDYTPSGNNTIIKLCTEFDVVYLEIKKLISSSRNNTTNDNDLPINVLTDQELELLCMKELEIRLPKTLNLSKSTFEHTHMQLTNHQAQNKKVLLLYLHNDDDPFSQQFLLCSSQDDLKVLLEEYCALIAWNVENPIYHNTFIKTLKLYDCEMIEKLIKDKKAALIGFLPKNNKMDLSFCLKDYFLLEDLFTHFRVWQDEGIKLSNTVDEIEAIESFKRKLPVNIFTTLPHYTLEFTIDFICNAPLDERKALFLYFHHSECKLSKNLIKSLTNPSDELVKILNRSFIFIGWDIEEIKYHNALISALNMFPNLSAITTGKLMEHKKAAVFCLLPIAGNISVFGYVDDNSNSNDLVKALTIAEVQLKEEIQNEIELEKINNKTSANTDLGPEKMQAIWADMLLNRDYDRFEFNEQKFLMQKICYALSGPEKDVDGYDKNTKKEAKKIFDAIIMESSKFAEYKDRVEISFIYNCLQPLPEEQVKRAKKTADYDPNLDFTPVPVFILRKCRNSVDPCRIFIDNIGRVYENWIEYLNRNKHEECTMIVPLNGRYEVNEDGKVKLKRYLSPSSQILPKLLSIFDIVTSVAGVTAGGVLIVASLGVASLSVAPIAVIVAGVVGAGAGLWAIGRSINTIYDRTRHNETMSFLNSEARGAYINIVGGTLGFTGIGANLLLTQLISRGVNIGQGATYAINTLGVINLAANGAGILNSGYDVFDQWYLKNQKVSRLTWLQLTSSVLFFGHAVYSFKPAGRIIEETQAKVLRDYQDSLRSNRHRRTFNRLVKETMKTHNDNVTRAKAEVISAIKNIHNKDEVFATLTRNTKSLNEAGARYSAKNGKITLGGIIVDIKEFCKFDKTQTETFLSKLALEKSATPNQLQVGASFKDFVKNILSDIKVTVSPTDLINLACLTYKALNFCADDIKRKLLEAVRLAVDYAITNLPKEYTEQLDTFLPKNEQYLQYLDLGIKFFSQKVEALEIEYKKYVATGDKQYYKPLYDYINPQYIKRVVSFFEFVVKNAYSGFHLIKATLEELAVYITARLIDRLVAYYESKKKNKEIEDHSANWQPTKVKCVICKGHFFKKD